MTSWTVNVLNSISCPRCHGLLRRQEFRVECAGCGSGFETRHNLIDLCPDLVETDTLAQRAMESRAVSKIYERVFRPALTLLAGSPGYEEEESWLRHWFRPTAGPILDLACGTGRYTRMLIRRHDQPVIGVDVSWQMLRRAAARGGTYVRASAQALPVADDTLGGINCFGALHLFPDPGTAIAELGRTLHHGAPFTCLTASEAPRRQLQQTAIHRVTRLRFIPHADLEGWLDTAGMDLLEFRSQGLMAMFAARRRER